LEAGARDGSFSGMLQAEDTPHRLDTSATMEPLPQVLTRKRGNGD
jgi:hypothetical protein